MATIVYSSYVIRYPVGGILSSNLQFLQGFARLGHEVVLVESSGWENSCFDPSARTLSDDPSPGLRAMEAMVAASGAPIRWAYVDRAGAIHGLDRSELERVFRRADLFIDRGLHGTFADEAASVPVRVLVDPDPGYRQIQMEQARRSGAGPPDFDAYYTYGHHVGTERSGAPTAGIEWRHVLHPIDVHSVEPSVPSSDAAFTTVMNWRSMPSVELDGRTYGMKDLEFPKFETLPTAVSGRFEMAVEGRDVDRDRLRRHGWAVTDAVHATRDLAAYRSYVADSFGEFSVLKQAYVALNVGWFSDRSAQYLAHGRPVVVQDNGLGEILPVGEGLFSVDDVDSAAVAVDAIRRDPRRHSAIARRIAEEYLDTDVVLGRFLTELGLPARGHT